MRVSLFLRRAGRVGGALLGAALVGACADPVATGPLAPASVSVAPVTTSVAIGATALLAATVLDADGQRVTDVPVSWRSSDPALAKVSESGVVTGVAVGTATITARADTRQGTAQITVYSAGSSAGTVDFAAIKRGIRPRGFGATPYTHRAPASGARVWYVAPGGSDAAAGTDAAPLKTINRAAQLAQAGDVVTIRAGTYDEAVSVAHSGTVDKPVVIQAAERGTVVLTGGRNMFKPASDAVGYVAVRGLIFRRYSDPLTSDQGIAALRAAQGWVVEDALFDEAGRIAISILGSGAEITRTTIQRSYVDAIHAWTPTDAATGPTDPAYAPLTGIRITDVVLLENNVTPNPLVGSVAEYVAKLWGTRGALIDNIESYGNNGPGFWFDTDNSDYTIRNSYFHDNKPVAGSNNEYGKGLFLEVSWGPGLVERNVFVNNGGAGLALDNVQGVQVRDNLFVGNAHCVTFVNGDRGNNPDGQPRWPLKNIAVHDNQCRDWTARGAMATIYGTFGSPAAMGIVADANTYDPLRATALADWFSIGTFSALAEVQSKLGWEQNGRVAAIPVP
ncbi:MAG TPA: right-handed parallel beta-helix repeat-containing protein [Gemmatimonadaceae bacterium]|nr:right-handed parallel beta-helix repeat-containing protein [Gemmatimonadaceae bacterium]